MATLTAQQLQARQAVRALARAAASQPNHIKAHRAMDSLRYFIEISEVSEVDKESLYEVALLAYDDEWHARNGEAL